MINFLSSLRSRKEKNSRNPAVKLGELKILNNRVLLFKLCYSKEIRKYFSSNLFWVEYDNDIHNVNKSILQIPVVSSLLPLAWAMGADIYVKEIDQTFLESINQIRTIMKKWYPRLSFDTRIHAEKTVSNMFSNKGYGLLFSGGVDSTSSYIRNSDKKPNFIMIWGADIPLDNKKFWEKVKKTYSDFTYQENLKINFIKTNMRNFTNQKLIAAKFTRFLPPHYNFWGGLQHGISLLGLCAPITITEGIGTLLIASSISRQTMKFPWGSHPLIDNKVSWADVKVFSDSYDLTRREKIRYMIKNFTKSNERYLTLRSCYHSREDLNCNECEKCSRTIVGLLLANIDPNKCGFNINDSFLDDLKRSFIEKKVAFLYEGDAFTWRDIQRNISEAMDVGQYGCEKFFRWIKNYDLSRNVKKRSIDLIISCYLFCIYYKLPEKARNAISRLPNFAWLASD